MLKQIPLPSKNLISIAILIFGLAVSFLIVSAQTDSSYPNPFAKITFPIAELGNCKDQADCKVYCDNPNHIEACVSFAEKNNLMSAEEAAHARAFIKAGKRGPGGCKNREECENFCNDQANIAICIQFAKDHGLLNKEEVDEAEKVEAVLKRGVKTPGGCHNKHECENYCNNQAHTDECLAFAQKAGFVKPEEVEQAKRAMNLMAQGKTPGGCKSKEDCMDYCESSNHLDECLKFGVENGLMTKEQADLVKKTGGLGPGDCRARQCEDFCNNPVNQETCFKFAEEHHLIPSEDVHRLKETVSRLREGLENIPPEVAQCLKETAGQNILDDIQSGKITPGPAIGEKVKSCFEKFGKKVDPGEVFKNAPPQVITCLKEKIGPDFQAIQSGQKLPSPEMADAMRVCFQAVRFEQFEKGAGQGGGAPTVVRGGEPGRMPNQLPNPADFLRNAPPGIISCLQSRLGDDFEKLKNNQEGFKPEFGEKVKECLSQFKPQMPMMKMNENENEEGRKEQKNSGHTPCPMMPTVQSCPAGQEKFLMFQSSQCGVYYGCRASAGGGQSKQCKRTGCSGQICASSDDIVSTCEFRPQYICYQKAICEVQANGNCGWTQTSELTECLKNGANIQLPQQIPSTTLQQIPQQMQQMMQGIQSQMPQTYPTISASGSQSYQMPAASTSAPQSPPTSSTPPSTGQYPQYPTPQYPTQPH